MTPGGGGGIAQNKTSMYESTASTRAKNLIMASGHVVRDRGKYQWLQKQARQARPNMQWEVVHAVVRVMSTLGSDPSRRLVWGTPKPAF